MCFRKIYKNAPTSSLEIIFFEFYSVIGYIVSQTLSKDYQLVHLASKTVEGKNYFAPRTYFDNSSHDKVPDKCNGTSTYGEVHLRDVPSLCNLLHADMDYFCKRDLAILREDAVMSVIELKHRSNST